MDPSLPAEVLARLDAHFETARTAAHAPGLAYGVVHRGRLIHAAGLGRLRAGGDTPPDERSVFRIASMTKSFTASAVLLLRDEDRLRLDDPVARYVPELSAWRGPTADSPAVTIRHLLTMSAGMATDDPWGDRHLDADRARMDALFAAGATFARVPGIAFVYSNYGYAALGRVIENVTGQSCQSFVTERLLRPLGMRDTGWERPGHANVADGHRFEDGAWSTEPSLADGGFAPMGGLWSTVADLAVWIGYWCDAFPARDGDDPFPLPRATRREMQQAHRAWAPSLQIQGGRAHAAAGGYGMGLHALSFSHLGDVVGHSGGLPGFGSNMRWWPERGLGVVALANVTYAPMWTATLRAAELLHGAGAVPPGPTAPAVPVLDETGRRLAALLARWDDEAARDLFAMNVALDLSLERRASDAAGLVVRHGPLRLASITPESHAAATMVLDGARGSVRVLFDLSAEVPPRIQFYECTSVLEPPALVRSAAEGFLASDDPDLVAGRAVIGPCRLGAVRACEGEHQAVFVAHGEHGDLEIDVTVDEAGALLAHAVRPASPGAA